MLLRSRKKNPNDWPLNRLNVYTVVENDNDPHPNLLQLNPRRM